MDNRRCIPAEFHGMRLSNLSKPRRALVMEPAMDLGSIRWSSDSSAAWLGFSWIKCAPVSEMMHCFFSASLLFPEHLLVSQYYSCFYAPGIKAESSHLSYTVEQNSRIEWIATEAEVSFIQSRGLQFSISYTWSSISCRIQQCCVAMPSYCQASAADAASLKQGVFFCSVEQLLVAKSQLLLHRLADITWIFWIFPAFV